MQNFTQRPQMHFTPPTHWINDPNGLVFHDGLYHLYYQHNPYGRDHGSISWGHATSPDLCRWAHHPVAIPAPPGAQIFSGSVVIDETNSSGLGDDESPPLIAIYTFATPEGQSQALACSRDGGYVWTQYAGNPVLDRGTQDFRDPKIVRYDNGHDAYWVMAAVEAQDRQVLFYRSEDLKHWSFLSAFGPCGPVGGVWECPDLFQLPLDNDPSDPRWILLVSINPGGIAGGSGTHYVVGHFDGTSFTPERTHAAPVRTTDGAWPVQRRQDLELFDWLDYGRDFYAGATFYGLPDEQRTLMAWMSNWDYASSIPTDPWVGAMALPRRLELVTAHGRPQIRQHIVAPPLEPDLCIEHLAIRAGAGRELAKLPAAGRIRASFRLAHPTTTLILRFEDAVGGAARITFTGTTGTVGFERSGPIHDSIDKSFASSERFQSQQGASLSFDIWFDTTSLEIVAEEGLSTLTDQVFLDPASRALSIDAAQGGIEVVALRIDKMGIR